MRVTADFNQHDEITACGDVCIFDIAELADKSVESVRSQKIHQWSNIGRIEIIFRDSPIV
jgi:hypothetical protein